MRKKAEVWYHKASGIMSQRRRNMFKREKAKKT